MEPEVSLPWTQHPASFLYPKPQSILRPLHLISWIPILILSSHLRLGFSSVLFQSGFPAKPLSTPLLSSVRTTCSCPHVRMSPVYLWMFRCDEKCVLKNQVVLFGKYLLLYHNFRPLFSLWYDIFVNCNLFVTRWQKYSTHLHTNNR